MFYFFYPPISDKRCSPPTKKSSPTEVPKQEETVSPPISFVKCNNTDGTDVISKFCNNTACGTFVTTYSHSRITSQMAKENH